MSMASDRRTIVGMNDELRELRISFCEAMKLLDYYQLLDDLHGIKTVVTWLKYKDNPEGNHGIIRDPRLRR